MKLSLPEHGLDRSHRAPGACTRRFARGVSLTELLVVILILGVLFMIGGRGVGRAWKRQKVQSAANDLKVLLQRAVPEMQRRNMVTFVQVGPLVNSGGASYLPIYLVGDQNASGALDAFARPPTVAKPDLLIDEYDVIVTGVTGVKGISGATQDFTLSSTALNEIESLRWSDDATDWTKVRSLMCDFQGRTVDTIALSGRQLVGPATLVLEHVDCVLGSLMPPTRYVLSINPVWSVRIQKQIRDSAGVWVEQLGG